MKRTKKQIRKKRIIRRLVAFLLTSIMTVAIIFGVILLRATTGFSIFQILGNVFKAMF